MTNADMARSYLRREDARDISRRRPVSLVNTVFFLRAGSGNEPGRKEER
jgi:hypothetical protein